MTETLVRTAASTQGQAELAGVGVEVSGPLSCQTTQEGDAFEVACRGTALDGRPVTVDGYCDVDARRDSRSRGTSWGPQVGRRCSPSTAWGADSLSPMSRRPLGSAQSARGAL